MPTPQPRPPAVAGRFYPAEPQRLAADVQRYLNAATAPEHEVVDRTRELPVEHVVHGPLGAVGGQLQHAEVLLEAEQLEGFGFEVGGDDHRAGQDAPLRRLLRLLRRSRRQPLGSRLEPPLSPRLTDPAMNGPFPNRTESGALGRWVLRAFLLGLAAGVVAATAALLN